MENFNFWDEENDLHIDLTPLIDCLFILIIFFVLTMSFSQPVLEIVLPEAKNTEQKHHENEILVNVKADGSLWLNEKEKITLDLLAKQLDNEPNKILNIYMDKRTPFEYFVQVLDLAKLKREGRFIISTDEQY